MNVRWKGGLPDATWRQDDREPEHRLLTAHYGFVSDYLAEALREQRKRSQVGALDAEFSLGPHLSSRDERAVRKTVSGLLKILHPDGGWTRAELREYAELALEGRRRVKEQLKKLAPHDYAKTAFSYTERDTGREHWVEVAEQPEEPPVEQALDADLDGAAPPRGPDHGGSIDGSLEELIQAGESASVEFKQSARWNEHKGDKDKVLELAVLKTVAGFMNARGGTLLVGVRDDGQVVGVEADYRTIANGGRDRYENWLTTLFETSLGKPAAAHAHIQFEPSDGRDVCRIDVDQSPKPVYLKRGDAADLYVRINNSTRLLNTAEAVEYIASRWR